MHYICRSFIGTTDDGFWSQYWENEPDDIGMITHRGHLFALVNLNVPEDQDASTVGHLLIDSLNQTYFSSLDVAAPIWLKRTLESVVATSKISITDISLTVAVVLNGVLHLAVYNAGQVVLHRGSKISQIISAIPGSVVSISGKVVDGDQLLLCTPTFFDQFTFAKIKQYLVLPKVQDIEENFLAILYTFTSQSTIAGAFIQIYQDEEVLEAVSALPPMTSVSAIVPPAKKNIFEKIFQSRPVFVTHTDSNIIARRKKFNTVIALIVLVTLGVSIYFSNIRNQKIQVEKKYQELKTQFEVKYNNAVTIKSLSLTESQTAAAESKEVLKSMLPLKIHIAEINDLIAKVDTLLAQTGSADSYKPVHFYDTTNINSQAKYAKMYLAKNFLYLLDSTNTRIDRLDIGNKSQIKISASSLLNSATDISETGGVVYTLINKQIYQVDNNALVSKIDITKTVNDFNSGSFNFWNGNLYLLADSSGLWKFTPNATGFGDGVSWLKDKEVLPASAASFAINGEVWVLGKNGEIVPYNRGVRDTFKSNSVVNLASAFNLVTAVDSNVLAFTEKDNLVYIIHKDGTSAVSYNFGKLKINSLAMSTSGNIIYVLCDDQQIYQIKL